MIPLVSYSPRAAKGYSGDRKNTRAGRQALRTCLSNILTQFYATQPFSFANGSVWWSSAAQAIAVKIRVAIDAK
jgi:hypothetical protein